MKFILRRLLALCCCLTALFGPLSCFAAAEAETVQIADHHFSITLPENTVLLDQNTASEQKELIESFGYTVSSFKNYLSLNQMLFFAADPQTGLQISCKTWESDFSADTEDLSYLSEEMMASVASKIVTGKGASYKTVSVGTLRLLEIRTEGKDSGGAFSSMQYVTIRNGAFYSVNVAFSGELDDSKVQTAWDLICTLQIKSRASTSAWSFSSIFEMILIWVLILLALVAIVIVILSFIKDIRSRRADRTSAPDYIERRNRRNSK